MVPKLQSAIRAVDGGVPRVHLLDGRVEHALVLELFTPEGIGTMIAVDAPAAGAVAPVAAAEGSV
jgi:acetylglutamate kinase